MKATISVDHRGSDGDEKSLRVLLNSEAFFINLIYLCK